jgi:hypothetical protein
VEGTLFVANMLPARKRSKRPIARSFSLPVESEAVNLQIINYQNTQKFEEDTINGR